MHMAHMDVHVGSWNESWPVELNELDETCEFEVIIKVGEQLW